MDASERTRKEMREYNAAKKQMLLVNWHKQSSEVRQKIDFVKKTLVIINY